jgi:15-cis-phytoene synthase
MLHDEAIPTCLAALERGDPDRFLAVMAAPVAARGVLAVLYAFNLEIARAPWVTREPLVARMRLQFWREVVAEADRPRAHEVAGPLAALIRARDLPEELFLRMICAREAEVDGDLAADIASLRAYVADSSGALMALAVRALGNAADEIAQGYGAAQGMANYLMAVPALAAAGRRALPEGKPEELRELARWGLEGLGRARQGRGAIARTAWPALLAAWRARPILRQVLTDPEGVSSGRLGQSEFSRRGGLLWASLVGP